MSSNAQQGRGQDSPPASLRKPVTPAPRSRLRRPPALCGRLCRRAECYPSPPFPRPVRGLWRRSGRSGRPVCGGCVRWRWSAAADKMVKVLKAKTRYQHHSGLWPPDSSPAISPARIAAKPFLPYCGLPENEAVGAGDFTGGALLCYTETSIIPKSPWKADKAWLLAEIFGITFYWILYSRKQKMPPRHRNSV